MKPIVRFIKEIHHRIKNNKNEEIPHDVLALKAVKRLLRKEQRQTAVSRRNDS